MILPLNDKPPATIVDHLRKQLTFETPLIDKTIALPEPKTGTRHLSVAEPQPIYTSTIDALLEGRLLATAYQSGWQYVCGAGVRRHLDYALRLIFGAQHSPCPGHLSRRRLAEKREEQLAAARGSAIIGVSERPDFQRRRTRKESRGSGAHATRLT